KMHAKTSTSRQSVVPLEPDEHGYGIVNQILAAELTTSSLTTSMTPG
ncbi:hypothetical protein V3C99_006086, partial [Haemonchus contortus]